MHEKLVQRAAALAVLLTAATCFSPSPVFAQRGVPSQFTRDGCDDLDPNDDFAQQCTARIEQEAASRNARGDEDFSRAWHYLKYKIYDQAIAAYTQEIELLEAASRTRRPKLGLGKAYSGSS